jgi:hypothetical protein
MARAISRFTKVDDVTLADLSSSDLGASFHPSLSLTSLAEDRLGLTSGALRVLCSANLQLALRLRRFSWPRSNAEDAEHCGSPIHQPPRVPVRLLGASQRRIARKENDITQALIVSAIDRHRRLGPGPLRPILSPNLCGPPRSPRPLRYEVWLRLCRVGSSALRLVAASPPWIRCV